MQAKIQIKTKDKFAYGFITLGMDANCVTVVELQNNFKSLTANEDLPVGTFLGDFRGKICQKNRHTVQIGADTHIESEGGVTYTNHSCYPNAQMVYHARADATKDNKEGFTIAWHMIACRDIKKGEPITFDYTTTEYCMAEPFDCICKSKDCLGRVQGFKFLSNKEKEKRLPLVSPVIKTLHENESV